LLRSVLSCLGIAVGIGAFVALMEVGQGTAESVRQRIASLGANFIQVEAGSNSSSGIHMGAGTTMTLTPEDAEAIVRECSTIRWAAPGVDCRMQVIYGNRNWQPWKVLGTSPDYLRVRQWALEEGESFTDHDVRGSAAVCLVGQTPARELFGNASPVGAVVRINGVPLTVVGVLTPKGANMMGLDQDDLVVAPWTTVRFRINGSKLAEVNMAASTAALTQVNSLSHLYPSQQAQSYPQASPFQAADNPQLRRFAVLDDIFLSVNSPEEIPQAIDQVTQLLRQRHRMREGEPDDFGIRNWVELSKALGSTTATMTNLLLAVGLISLAAGGIGIMNIMLVSVTERTREIGIRMAVGGRPKHILRQFLAEAVLLCLLGGLAGVVLGRVTSVAIAMLLGWPTVSSILAIVMAVATSAAVGLISGYYPAWKASRLDPIEALRHE
jgi:ABC-type antimicrobial peptide transport system permease subunit